ncbi:MAG TPA: hypothetical protein VIW03_01585, partial [Anaeromyxobacter sp.]
PVSAAAPKRPDAFRAAATPTSAAPATASAPKAEIDHPQATPASVLMPGATPRVAPEAARTGTGSRSIPLPSPAPERATSSSTRVPAATPRLEPPRAGRPPASGDASRPKLDVELPLDDPFAAAAAHAKRGADLETTAPVFRTPRAAAQAARPAAEPPPPADPGAGLLLPAEDDETSIELSVSEQYQLAPRKSGGGRTVAVAATALVFLLVGGAGAYVWKTRGAPRPGATAPRAPRASAAAAPRTTPPPVPEPAPAQPAPAPVPPPAIRAAPAAETPAPSQVAAAPPPAAAIPPPAAATPPPPPREEPPKRAEPPRLSAAERRDAARRAAADRKAEAARAAEEKRAEAARRAEADRIARAERNAAAERKAEETRKAEAQRRAEAARKAEAERVAQAEKKAEADRRAEAERRARADRRTASAAPAGGVAFEREQAEPQKPKPAVDPALAEALKRKEEAVAPRAQPIAEGLDPAEMQAVLRANRAALETCVERALSDPATAVYAGRKVSLIILVAPNGRAEAAVEEPDLDASAFGTCLRRAAARMSFPAFRGEPVGARIPLVLGRG